MTSPQNFTITIDNKEITVETGATVAAALLQAGIRTFRHTPHHKEPRSLFCGMGMCYDCLVTVNGKPNVRACVTPVRPGMRVETDEQVFRPEPDSVVPEPRARALVPVREEVELAIVGAGPAGIGAALVAAQAGVQVTLIDSAPQLGGQYFKQPQSLSTSAKADSQQQQGRALLVQVQANDAITEYTDALVWGAFAAEEGGWLLTLQGPDVPHQIHAQTLILAPGAYDRPIAFPGWTLPGVLTAGAAQTLLKTQGITPGQRILLSGSGPLQWIVAAELIEAGAEVVAVLEGAAFSSLRRLRHLPAVWGQWSRLGEGLAAWHTLRKAGVSLHFARAAVAAYGQTQVEAVDIAQLDARWRPRPQSIETVAVDTLIVGYGFLPQTQLTRLLGCEHSYDARQGGWVPLRDETMQTSLPGVYAVGDGAGVGGAVWARLEGEIAGWAAAQRLGKVKPQTGQERRTHLQRAWYREQRFTQLLQELFTPGPGLYTLAQPETLICRCEEVSLEEIRQAWAQGARTLREIKGLTRLGMGNCQGRICGDLAAHLLVDGEVPTAVYEEQLASLGDLHVRPPIHPLKLSDLAAANRKEN